MMGGVCFLVLHVLERCDFSFGVTGDVFLLFVYSFKNIFLIYFFIFVVFAVFVLLRSVTK